MLAENVNLTLHGQIGKAWIYWYASGHQFKRPYKIPDDPKTFTQRTQRNKFYVVTQMWNELTTEEQTEWKNKVLKTQYTMTGYNYYIREKIKEITQMVKKITHGTQVLTDGLNVIVIDEIQLDKTSLNYNCYAVGVAGTNPRQEAIKSAWFYDSTHLHVDCMDSAGIGTVTIKYIIIEYV